MVNLIPRTGYFWTVMDACAVHLRAGSLGGLPGRVNRGLLDEWVVAVGAPAAEALCGGGCGA